MRVFLVQTAQGLTPSSGGYKANVNLLRMLCDQGHEAAQICYGVDLEIEEYASRAEAKGIQPNVTNSVLSVFDTQGVEHQLLIKTFTDQYKVYNVVISRKEFNAAFPVQEFRADTKAYLQVSFCSARCLLCPHCHEEARLMLS
jgi:hypothetical protein